MNRVGEGERMELTTVPAACDCVEVGVVEPDGEELQMEVGEDKRLTGGGTEAG